MAHEMKMMGCLYAFKDEKGTINGFSIGNPSGKGIVELDVSSISPSMINSAIDKNVSISGELDFIEKNGGHKWVLSVKSLKLDKVDNKIEVGV